MNHRQGSGFRYVEGFWRNAETGYAIRETRYGCQPEWGGYYADYFNRTAANLGAEYNQAQSSGGMKTVAGTLVNQGTRDAAIIMCSSMPNAMPHQSVQAKWISATFGVGVDGSGPAVYMHFDNFGLAYYYGIRVINADGAVGSTQRVSLVRSAAGVESGISGSVMPDHPPFGPLDSHTYKLEANQESATHSDDVRLTVYVDGVSLFNFLDDTASRLAPARPGFIGGANTVWKNLLVRELP